MTITLTNGDLKALNEIVEKWGFRSPDSAIKFAIAVLLSGKEKLQVHIVDSDGIRRRILPNDDLLNTSSDAA